MFGMGRCYRSVCLLLMFSIMIGCGQKQDKKADKLFSLEKSFSLDTENNETAEMGLTDVSHFDVDSEGKIFIANPRTKENLIYILDQNGSLLSAFGSRGQGPGELQSPMELVISNKDEVFVTDRGKVVVYSNIGQYIKEFRINTDYQKIIPLDKEKYLAIAVIMKGDMSQSFQVILCSSDLEAIKILDSSKIESFQKAAKVNIIPTLVYWEQSPSYIYTGTADKYEIRMFELSGDLIRSITRDHEPVLLSDEQREEYNQRMQRYPPEIKENFFIPEAFPPVKDIVALGDKWLFVQTYAAATAGYSVYDIFNKNGEFLSSTELEGYQVKFKGDNLYCLKQKESGYKELVVYRMIWD